MVRTKVMTVMRWYAQDKVNQEESEHNEVDGMKKGVDSTGEVMHCILPECPMHICPIASLGDRAFPVAAARL